MKEDEENSKQENEKFTEAATMHREHNDASGDDVDEDDVVGGFLLSPVRRRACSAATGCAQK
eukprot:3252788-Pyramimonas_sp.AAC.1